MDKVKPHKRRFSRKERLALATIAGFVCEICGTYLHKYEADHKHPFSKGGETHVRNGQALCQPCNRKKGAKYEPPQMAEERQRQTS
jgi:hypothetical protein